MSVRYGDLINQLSQYDPKLIKIIQDCFLESPPSPSVPYNKKVQTWTTSYHRWHFKSGNSLQVVIGIHVSDIAKSVR